MAAVKITSPARTSQLAAGLLLLVGVVAAALVFREVRNNERGRAIENFSRRAAILHTLTAEILSRYENALRELGTLFSLSGGVTREEFSRAARQLAQRNPGVQAFEWVPFVPAARRAEIETALGPDSAGRPRRLMERDPSNRLVVAAERDEYYPITFVEPLQGNESVLGYDIRTAPTAAVLAHARQNGRITLSGQFPLMQETADQLGIVMIWPVFSEGNGGAFRGFVQGVFRVRDMLEATRGQTLGDDNRLEMMFVDDAETNPARRVLLSRLLGPDPAENLTEDQFRQGLHLQRDMKLADRPWHIIYRPRPGWLENQLTYAGTLRAGAILVISGLLASLIMMLGRRSAEIERQVRERTAELADSRRQLSTLLHALPGMAWRSAVTPRLEVIYVSEGAVRLTGHSVEDIVSGRVHFRDLIHPDDLPRVRQHTRAALAERTDLEVEYRLRHASGGERWILSRGRGVYASDGRPQFFEGLAIDITAQRQAEAERLALEHKLLEGQNLESLGHLAGGIAHNFNNLLTGIMGNAGLARLSLPPDSPLHREMQMIEASSQRAAELCRQMLAYAGQGRFAVEPLDLGELVRGMQPLLDVTVHAEAQLLLRLASGLPAVTADAAQLRQIVLNLVRNASEALGGRPGEITLATAAVRLEAAQLRDMVAGTSVQPGVFVCLEVIDNGGGIPPEVIRRIFDPYYTTKFAGRGLGLAATLGIVRSHGGALQVASTPGRGSTFRVFLPASGGVPPAAAPATPAKAAPSQPPSVLIVDDDEAVRDITVEILRTLGYPALTAPSGDEAVRLFAEHRESVAIVLLDLLMPGMSGEQTLAALRAIRPDTCVLFISGYSEGDVLTRCASPVGKLGFLQKPFSRATLSQKLRDLLA